MERKRNVEPKQIAMSDKFHPQKFAEIMPFSALSEISGVIAISSMSQYQVSACIFGILGIANFILSIKYDADAEKSEKRLAFFGFILSVISILFVLISLIRNKFLVS